MTSILNAKQHSSICNDVPSKYKVSILYGNKMKQKLFTACYSSLLSLLVIDIHYKTTETMYIVHGNKI